MKVTIKSIDEVVRASLSACGVSDGSIDIILDTMHYANRRGVPTHGAGRLPLYVKKIRAGHLNPLDQVEVLMDSGAMALLDGHNGFGQVAAAHAMDIAVKKAREFGVAAVGVRNSNNFGTAGFFGDMAARQGLAAIIFANAAPAIAPTGGNRTIFGTNPLCYAFPGTDREYPIVLDMATTIAARGKIRLAAKNGERIPMDWATGPDGKPTDDPNAALQGALLPIGGYKGYGLSLFVDVFAGLMTGSAYAGGVKPLSNMEHDSGNGHLFILMDVSRFMTAEERKERIETLHRAVKDCGEADQILLPGERGYHRAEAQTESVEISRKQFDEINEIAASVGVERRITDAE